MALVNARPRLHYASSKENRRVEEGRMGEEGEENGCEPCRGDARRWCAAGERASGEKDSERL